MANMISQSELVRRAIVFIDTERRENPNRSVAELLDAAGMRFNLSPLECEELARLFRPEKGQKK